MYNVHATPRAPTFTNRANCTGKSCRVHPCCVLAGVALRQEPEGAGKAPQARGMLELSGQGSSHPATYVGHGQRGTVSVARERCPTTHTERLVATKRRRPSAPAHTIEREAEFLGVANRHGIGPRFL